MLAGQNREKNLFYQIVRIIPSPFVKLFRLLTPQVFEDRVIPFADVLRAVGDLPVARVRDPAGRAVTHGRTRDERADAAVVLDASSARWCQAFKQSDTALKYYGYALAAAPDDPKMLASIGFELAQAGRKREALAYVRPRRSR